MIPEGPFWQRVIVNRLEQSLSKMMLGELRLQNPDTRTFEQPKNLDYVGFKETPECQASKIWQAHHYNSLGKRDRAVPDVQSRQLPESNSDLPTNAQAGADRISRWTTNVPPGANPSIDPETPVEAELPTPAPVRRRIVLESDSDDDEPPARPLKTKAAIPQITKVDSPTLPEAAVVHTNTVQTNPLINEHHEINATLSGQDDRNALALNVNSEDQVGLDSAVRSQSTKKPFGMRTLGDSLPKQPAEGAPLPLYQASPLGEPSLSTMEDPPLSFVRPKFTPHGYRGSTRTGQETGSYRGQHSQRGQRGRHVPGQPNLQRVSPVDKQAQEDPSTDTDMAIPRESQSELIDIGVSTTPSHAPAIPPGLYSTVRLSTKSSGPGNIEPSSSYAARVQSGNTPIQTHHPSPSQTARSPMASRRPTARSGSSASGVSRASSSYIQFSQEGSNYVNTTTQHMSQQNNQRTLRQKSLQDAMALAQSLNKKADDPPQPKLHSTMRQKAKNPGKNATKNLSKKEQASRQAKIDAVFGAVPSSYPAPAQHPPPETEVMSEWKKKQIKKQQTPMAAEHPEIVANAALEEQTSKLISILKPVFEIGRALKGVLGFEIQVGQVLITSGQALHSSPRTPEEWTSLFARPGSGHTFSTFTKILTSNGADIDRMLATAKPRGRRGTKETLWSAEPATRSICYEFQCQTRSNENFQVIVDENGGHKLRKGILNVGAINIHVPAQIWDLSAALSAPLEWFDAPDAIVQSAEAFVQSLYVEPGRKKLMLYFREPADQEIKIRNLIVRRTSYHSTHNDSKLLLKVVEAKNLLSKNNADDKKLWLAYEPVLKHKDDYRELLAHTGRIHYEMSVIHSDINNVLKKNESLEVGELTDAAPSGASLLSRPVIRAMLDTALQTVCQIDFVGMWNYGTQARLDHEEAARLRELHANLGPQGSRIANSRTRTFQSSTAGEGAGTTERPLVPGVRANTLAEVVVDETGRKYLAGAGGSRVPLADQDGISSADTVTPDDSASQTGGMGRLTDSSKKRNNAFW
jgi:hypothetical protein